MSREELEKFITEEGRRKVEAFLAEAGPDDDDLDDVSTVEDYDLDPVYAARTVAGLRTELDEALFLLNRAREFIDSLGRGTAQYRGRIASLPDVPGSGVILPVVYHPTRVPSGAIAETRTFWATAWKPMYDADVSPYVCPDCDGHSPECKRCSAD